ncbi:unnamed protein product, partial [Tetraodon nigroviridis]
VGDRQRQQPGGRQPDSRPEPGPLQPPHLLDLRDHQHHQRPEDERTERGRGLEGRRQQAKGHRRQRGERVSSILPWCRLLGEVQVMVLVARRGSGDGAGC